MTKIVATNITLIRVTIRDEKPRALILPGPRGVAKSILALCRVPLLGANPLSLVSRDQPREITNESVEQLGR